VFLGGLLTFISFLAVSGGNQGLEIIKTAFHLKSKKLLSRQIESVNKAHCKIWGIYRSR
jgi:hypothetical protein